MARKVRTSNSKRRGSRCVPLIWWIWFITVILLASGIAVKLHSITTSISYLFSTGSDPDSNISSSENLTATKISQDRGKAELLVQVWCDLTWTLYLPTKCINQDGSRAYPCYIPIGDPFIVIVEATYAWGAEPDYYAYYLPDQDSMVELTDNIKYNNYYCEADIHNLNNTYPRGLVQHGAALVSAM